VAAMFRKMVIAGVGLIGGSMALAMRERGLVEEVVGYGRGEKNLRVALKKGMIDGYFLRAEEIPNRTDFLVLGTPVQSTAPLAEEFLPHLEQGCIVSDVGSVKAMIVRDMEKILPRTIPFVGAHPIAGSERAGAAAANAELFVGARCIVTPTARTPPQALARVRALWEGVGARVEVMTPAAHDRTLAWTSHLVHALAYALVRGLDAADPTLLAGGGPSLRDATRVAASPAELWRDIFLDNADAVGDAIGHFAGELARLRDAIAAGDATALQALLDAAVLAKRRSENLS